MLMNYFIVAVRNLTREKGYSLTNITGLAIGLAVCMLIALWVSHEYSFDRFHQGSERMSRVTYRLEVDGSVLRSPGGCLPLGEALMTDVAGVEAAARVLPVGRINVNYGDQRFFESNIVFADSTFTQVFSFASLKGDMNTALSLPNSLVMTAKTAAKYFGDEDPMGKVLRLESDEDYTVTGVLEDVPDNSSLVFDMVIPFEHRIRETPFVATQWDALGCPIYIKLRDAEDLARVEADMAAMVEANLGDELRASDVRIDFSLQPLEDIHLHSDYERDRLLTGDIRYVYLFLAIAVMVLIMAAINFVNLTTARAARRALEVGMRKSFGAPRAGLIVQFLGESAAVALVSLVVSVFMVELFLPTFNELAGRNISLDFLEHPQLIFYAIGLALLTGMVAGLYPAIYLSSFQPLRAMRLRSGARTSRSNLRRALVVFQFTVSIALIMATLTVGRQISYMKGERLGFDKERVVAIRGMDDLPEGTRYVLRDELAALGGVEAVSLGSGIPGGNFPRLSLDVGSDSEEREQLMLLMAGDEGYAEALGLEIVEGRGFSREISSDRDRSVLINEAAARRLGWEDPVGRTIRREQRTADGLQTAEYSVIGVLRDFHYQSLHSQIEPCVLLSSFAFQSRWGRARFLVIRLGAGDPTETVDRIDSKWAEIVPERPMDFFFLDDTFNSLYQSEERLGRMALWLSVLAILVGCLGLFGISAYAVEQRAKEIGIRKVLGASVGGIVVDLSSEFAVLVGIANLIGWPLGYYFVSDWLSEFAYHTSLGLGVFLTAGFITIVIALLTVFWQALKAARANPVEALKCE